MKPQSISFSANPTYHSVSNLIFCGPLVFQLIPATGNPKSRFHGLPTSAFHPFLPARQIPESAHRLPDAQGAAPALGQLSVRPYRLATLGREFLDRLAVRERPT